MIHILSQPYNDEFSLRLFFQLLEIINSKNKKFDAFYSWSTSLVYGMHLPPTYYFYPGEYFSKYIIDNINEDLIILGLKDHFTDNFNPWLDPYPQHLNLITEIFEHHRNKNFIVFTSLENLESYIRYPNVTIIPWGGDITNQMIEYRSLHTIVDKNINSDKIFLNINRNKRNNRLLTISLILGLDLEDHGLMSCMFQKELGCNFLDNFKFVPSYYKDRFSLYEKGYNKILNYQFNINDDYKIYNDDNDNFTNFNKKLKTYYQNTFVEIISETSFFESAFLITEKTQNSIYGGNFPIWISSKGVVSFLRTIGLDVFDDIIDHSYDLIDNPFDRANAAIKNNTRMLTDIDYVKHLWITNRPRFEKNVKFLNNNFYQLMYDRAKNKFISSIS